MASEQQHDLIRDLLRDLQSSDSEVRVSAAQRLGRIYAVETPEYPPLVEVARLIGDANDVTADLAAPFVRQFIGCPSMRFDESWETQTGSPLSDWLCDMLCRQPDANPEFAAAGLAATARDYLNGSPVIVRRILQSGKAWRAFIIASGAREPSEEDKALMEEMAWLDDSSVASRATWCLASRYDTLHDRGIDCGWVLPQTVDEYCLYWCRNPKQRFPSRVWGRRSDLQSFAVSEAEAAVKKIIAPLELGDPVRVYPALASRACGRRLRAFDHEDVRVVYEAPSSLDDVDLFDRFQVRPMRRIWETIDMVKTISRNVTKDFFG